jgi:hypothetical protein
MHCKFNQVLRVYMCMIVVYQLPSLCTAIPDTSTVGLSQTQLHLVKIVFTCRYVNIEETVVQVFQSVDLCTMYKVTSLK